MSQTESADPVADDDGPKTLHFKVAPHIVEDLGLNLYTSLPKVLVEFVANAYDADSAFANIVMDKDAIVAARTKLKADWDLQKSRNQPVPRLEQLPLPADMTIVIEDAGHGMRRKDLAEKFLIAGRRRRGEKNVNTRSPGNRVLMGRKGLGKLAGFGVAKVMTIESRAVGEDHATRIVLRYDELVATSDASDLEIEEHRLEDGGGFESSGTRIILSQLLYEPLGARTTTIERHAADHFWQVERADFEIRLNGQPIQPTVRRHSWAWPEPNRPTGELVDGSFVLDDGRTFTYRYRLRFMQDQAALPAKERGIRVYANKRLAAAPSLLEADTNMHGFRMTDYLDGVVVADFIDEQPEDYVATDRQGLRWESPLLYPLGVQLSEFIKQACAARQKVRDTEKVNEAKTDAFTNQLVAEQSLSKRETTVAMKVAAAIASLHKEGYDDPDYRTQIKEVVVAMSRGEIINSLRQLAAAENPEFDRLIKEVTTLTAEQLDGFHSYAKARVDGIKALRKIIADVDFKAGKNEQRLHDLLNRCPWLIDPTFFEFLASNVWQASVFSLLEKELKIGAHVPASYDPNAKSEVDPDGENLRPDLVFLLGSSALRRLVIVELKAPNTPLRGEHYRQLQGYISDAEEWLAVHKPGVRVEGLLIGSRAPVASKAKEVRWLEREIDRTGNVGQCRVFGIDVVLEMAEKAHRDLLEADSRVQL